MISEVDSSIISSFVEGSEIRSINDGSPNLSVSLPDVRRGFSDGSVSVSDVPALYDAWKNEELFYIYAVSSQFSSNPRLAEWGSGRRMYYECDFFSSLMMKRGNEVWCSYVKRRLSDVLDTCRVARKFDFSKGCSSFDAHVLLISLTYDTKRCSLDDAHDNIGDELHVFIDALRRAYPDVEFFRVFECFKRSHYPHAHICAVFPVSSFPAVFLSAHQTPKGRWVKSRFTVGDDVRDFISSLWHSWVDVRAVSDVRGVWYCMKYLSKDFQDSCKSSTPAFNWLFGRRSYDVSRGFCDALRYVCFSSGGWISPTDSFPLKRVFPQGCYFIGFGRCSNAFGLRSFPIDPPPLSCYGGSSGGRIDGIIEISRSVRVSGG
jgi:hypothetical protein